MDNRLFFVVGDLLANLAIGVIVALISWAIVGMGWNMWVAMIVMMVLGMVCGLFFFFPVGLVLGAMEAMVPLMVSGMLSGMVLGMWCAMTPLDLGHAALIGALCGFISITFVWSFNTRLRGITNEAEQS